MMDPFTKSVTSYQKLKAQKAQEGNTSKLKKLYEKIRTQSLIEVYISPVINKLITEEEMSGFILYLDERLETIVLAFRDGKTKFLNYLLQIAGFRALNYLEKKERMAKMDFALSKYIYAQEQERQYNAQWKGIFEEKQKYEKQETIDFLKKLCTIRPSFQRKLFIYLLSIFPYLTAETIDSLCQDFNFSLAQTRTIFNRLFDRITKKNSSTLRKKYLEQRNVNWAHFLYMQDIIEEEKNLGVNEKQQQMRAQAERFMKRNESANYRLDILKKNMNYADIARELKIPAGTISSTIYFVKNIFEAIGMEGKRDYVEIVRQVGEVQAGVKLPYFEPFKEFALEDMPQEDLLEE